MQYMHNTFDDMYTDEIIVENDIRNWQGFYINYGKALLSSIRNGASVKEDNLSDIVKALKKESKNGNEDAKDLIKEIYAEGYL